MYSETRIFSLLERMEEAVLLVQGQTRNILCADDFLNSPEGMFALGGSMYAVDPYRRKC